MPDYKLGMDAKLYYGAEGAALAILTEMTNVKDLTVPMERGEADVTTRANSGWRATAATLREGTVEWEMVWKEADAGFIAVKNAFINGTPLRLAALTGAKDAVGTEGLVGDFEITNFSRSEPLEEAISVSVTAKLSLFSQWLDVESSSSSA